jgi:hypothetical protein
MEPSTGRERMDGRRCVATASTTGERCRKAPVRGATVCWTHGGAVGRVKAAAARRVAESAAMAVYERYSANGDGPAVDVIRELARLAAEVRRFADFTGARVEALTAGEWRPDEPRAAAELSLYERAVDRASRLMVDLARLGIDARLAMPPAAALEQRTVDIMVKVVDGALADLGANPGSADVRAAVYARVRQHAPPPAGEGRD